MQLTGFGKDVSSVCFYERFHSDREDTHVAEAVNALCLVGYAPIIRNVIRNAICGGQPLDKTKLLRQIDYAILAGSNQAIRSTLDEEVTIGLGPDGFSSVCAPFARECLAFNSVSVRDLQQIACGEKAASTCIVLPPKFVELVCRTATGYASDVIDHIETYYNSQWFIRETLPFITKVAAIFDKLSRKELGEEARGMSFRDLILACEEHYKECHLPTAFGRTYSDFGILAFVPSHIRTVVYGVVAAKAVTSRINTLTVRHDSTAARAIRQQLLSFCATTTISNLSSLYRPLEMEDPASQTQLCVAHARTLLATRSLQAILSDPSYAGESQTEVRAQLTQIKEAVLSLEREIYVAVSPAMSIGNILFSNETANTFKLPVSGLFAIGNKDSKRINEKDGRVTVLVDSDDTQRAIFRKIIENVSPLALLDKNGTFSSVSELQAYSAAQRANTFILNLQSEESGQTTLDFALDTIRERLGRDETAGNIHIYLHSSSSAEVTSAVEAFGAFYSQLSEPDKGRISNTQTSINSRAPIQISIGFKSQLLFT